MFIIMNTVVKILQILQRCCIIGPKIHWHCFNCVYVIFSGKIHYTEIFKLLCQIDPPLGFGKKCPERMAYKKLIRMNMPMDKEGKVMK